MLYAIDKKGKQFPAQKVTKEHLLFCPVCQGRVILKNGKQKSAHFAHKSCKVCTGFSEGETEEHLNLKQVVFDWLQRHSPNSAIHLEGYLPKIRQRPDVLYETLAIEIQCSTLPYRRLEERTNTYRKNGYGVWWIIGNNFLKNKKLTMIEKRFCAFNESCGLHLWQLDWKKKQLILRYHMKETINGKITYEKKSWLFFSGVLPNLFNEIVCDIKPEILSKRVTYKRWLQQQLFSRHPKYIKLQGICYTYQRHLLYLPDWMYRDSYFFFYFKELVFLYRILYEEVSISEAHKSNHGRYLRWLQKLFAYKKSWQFPLVRESIIYSSFYEECRLYSMCKPN